MRAEEYGVTAKTPFVDSDEVESHDWSQTPLGAIGTWSDDLKIAVQRHLVELAQAKSTPKTLRKFDLLQNGAASALPQAVQADAFRVRLMDALRPLRDATEIQAIAARILGESLGASRVIYIEVVSDGEEVSVHSNYTDNVAALSGCYRLEDYHRNLTADHGAGRTQIVTDIPNHPEYTNAEKARYHEIDIAAHIDVPLVKNDRFVALLAAQQSAPRQWTETEVKLVEETAEQTWAAVERAHAEAALRESEERYRMLFESIDEGFCVVEVLFDAAGTPVDHYILQANPAFKRQTGITNPEGKRASELAPGLEQYWNDLYAQVIHTGESIRVENRSDALDRWFDVLVSRVGNAAMRRVAIVFSDISDRKQTEVALRESERKYRSLFESMNDGFCIIELLYNEQQPIDSRFLETNPAFERQSGLSDAIGKTGLDFAPNHDPELLANYHQALVTGKPIEFEMGIADLGRHYRISVSRHGDLQQKQLAIVFNDISERKQAEDIIATDLANTRLLHDLSARLIVEDNIQVLYDEILAAAIALTRADAGTVQILDDATQDILLLAAQGLNRTIADYFYRVDASSNTSCGVAMMTGTRAIINFDVPECDDPDGSLRLHAEAGFCCAQSTPLISRSGKTIGMVSTHWRRHYRPSDRELRFLDLLARQAADLIDRRQTEVALRESEEIKQSILDSSKDCIKVLTLDSEIIYMNRGGLRLLEIDNPMFILNTCWLDFWQGEAYEDAKTAIAAAKAGNTGQFQGYLPTHKGTPKWWDVLITPVRNSAGQVTQLLTASRDITKQKQAEAERERLLAQEQAAREQAETANRVKDEFLAVLSHELRSPLNPILGWTRLLQNRKLDAARQKEALAVIERNAKLQTQLIEDLLDISRIMQGKLALNVAPVSLTFVISAAVETVRLAAEAKKIEIVLDLDPSVAPVSGDAARLQQVVWNLLSNAVKFTPNNGQVTVELRQINQLAQIRVLDTGKGINPQFLPHVFEYFRQEDGSTTRQFGGLGLGLAIVRQIVESHGGRVGAESGGENQGATFIVQLPIAQQMVANASEPIETQTEVEAALAGIQILLVDDEPDTREFQAFVLAQSGATVTAVASGFEALQVLEEFIPDVLVSDIGMAGMDGYMLLQQIRSREASPSNLLNRGGTMRAIALTAYAADIDRQRVLRAGFQTHLTKPVEPEELVRTIASLLERN